MIRKSLVLSLSVMTCMAIGACLMNYHETSTITGTLKSVQLGECCKVSLQRKLLSEKRQTGPGFSREQLQLEIAIGDGEPQELALSIIVHEPGWQSDVFGCGRVEAHTDQTKHKAWFTNSESGRVLATYDLDSGKATGPNDDPPEWATSPGNQKT